jgi:tripartite-type tricarboxylate transporter receptor subunit TctC
MKNLTVAALLLVACVHSVAADYSNRALRIIVPFSPGGSTDVLARMIGRHLTEAWGQQVVVDNRAGANGVIAAELVAKSNPDGHSLLMVAIGHTTNPSLQQKLPYDTERDFQPISLTAIFPLLLAVHPTVKADSMQALPHG